MTLLAEPQNHPRLPEQQADIAVGSPIALVALFTEIVRERFRPGAQLAWEWHENYTPRASETGEPDLAGVTTDDGAARKVLIEPAFNVNAEVRNYRPAIYVDKGETIIPKDVINNFAGQQLRSGMKGFWGLGRVPMEIEVVSDVKGESATMADIVWFYLLSGREQIQQIFGLHDMGNPVLGRTMPFDADKTQWSTKITYQVELNFRWVTRPISPLLREIVLRFKNSGETNPDAFLLSQYIR